MEKFFSYYGPLPGLSNMGFLQNDACSRNDFVVWSVD